MNSTTDHNRPNTYYSTWRMATTKELLDEAIEQLAVTPRWRVLKRSNLKRVIKYWGGKL